jgi:predicted methyltransferase
MATRKTQRGPKAVGHARPKSELWEIEATRNYNRGSAIRGTQMKRIPITLIMLVTSLLTMTTAVAEDNNLADILAAQSDENRARYQYRNPEETLNFFGIEPGMTVVEALPGSVWYTGILLPYLGANGKVIGADYTVDTWTGIGYDSADFVASRKTWISDWTSKNKARREDNWASVDAFVFGALPKSLHGTADAVLFFRALHNMNYSAPSAVHLKDAVRNTWDVLKSGGIVGIVQHHARDDMSDAWSNGQNGYLKRDYVVDLMEAAGFELAAESDMNANNKDRPTESDSVWRLPPSYDGAQNDTARMAAVVAIGESNRMTLKFVKP